MGKPGRGQAPAIDQLPKDLRDKCIDLMMQGKKGCDTEVARLAGVSRQAICTYRRRHFARAMEIAGKLARAEAPDSQDVTALMAHRAEMVKDVASALPILAVRDNRLAAQQDRHNRMMVVVTERAVDMQSVPGGKSGLLVRQIKQIGSGDDAREVEEYKVDTGLLSELREHEKQIAIELGQWSEATGRGDTNVYVVSASVSLNTSSRPARVIDVTPSVDSSST